MANLDYIYEEDLKDHYLEQVLDTDKFKAFYLRQPGMGRMQSCMIMFSPEGINLLGDLCPGNDSRNSGCHAYGYGLSWFAQKLSGSYLCEKFLTKAWHPELAVQDCQDIARRIMLGETHRFDPHKALEEILDERADLAEQLADYRRSLRAPDPDPDAAPADEIRKDVKALRKEAAKLRELLLEKRTEHAQKYLKLAVEVDHGNMGMERFGEAVREIDSNCYDCMPGWGYQPRARALLCALQQKFAALYPQLAHPLPDFGRKEVNL